MAVSLHKIEFTPDRSRATVVVASDLPELPSQIEELLGANTRHFILAQTIEHGIKGSPGITSSPRGPYPINVQGEIIEDLRDESGNMLPPTSPRMQPQKYHVAFDVQAR